MNAVTVPVIIDDDGRRPDTNAHTWSLVADHGDTMTIQVIDTADERIAELEAELSAMRERVAAVEVTSVEAKALRDAIRRP
jgi:hypothetical protein